MDAKKVKSQPLPAHLINPALSEISFFYENEHEEASSSEESEGKAEPGAPFILI